MSAKHAENPHTFQSLQLNLRGEGNAEREKMKGDVKAGKHTKEPPQQSENLHFPLQPQHCESWHRQTEGITFLQAWPNAVAALYARRKHLTKLMCLCMCVFTCRNKARTRSFSKENRIPSHLGLLRDQDMGTQERNNDGWCWLDILCELNWVWLCFVSLRAADQITKPGLWR